MLYDSYPSQGTNTFWLDTGNYLKVPPILHPAKAPMRFYRIVDLEAHVAHDVAVAGQREHAGAFPRVYVADKEAA